MCLFLTFFLINSSHMILNFLEKYYQSWKVFYFLPVSSASESTRKGCNKISLPRATTTLPVKHIYKYFVTPLHDRHVKKNLFKGYKRRIARPRRSAASAPVSNAHPRPGRGCLRSREEELELLKLGQRGVRGCCRRIYDLINIAYTEKRVLSEGWLAKYGAYASYFWLFNIAHHVSLVKQQLFIYCRMLD